MILALWFPNWPIQRLQWDHRQITANVGKDHGDAEGSAKSADQVPIVLFAMHKNALRVSARCSVARAAGVSVGMPLAEARTVLGESIDASEHDAGRDTERLRELAVHCRRFSPVCGLDDVEQPDGLLLDISGCDHLFGGDEQLGWHALRELRSVGYRVKGGIGSTVGIAWAAARTIRDGVCVVGRDEQSAWLDRRRVGALRVGQRTVSGLAEFDLRTVGQIRRLPREQLPSRFGDELLRRLDQADGNVAESISPILPVETLKRSWTTEHPLRRPDLIDIVLERLLGQLASDLPNGVGVVKLRVLIVAEKDETVFDVAFSRPSREQRRFVELVSFSLERRSIPSGVDRVEVEAAGLDLITTMQTDIFGDPLDGELEHELSDLLEKVSSRIGDDRVLLPHLTPDPLPERSVGYSPATTTTKPDVMEQVVPFSRPLVLFPKPEPIRTWVINHRPQRVEHKGQSHDVAFVWGPERIESGWWRDESDQRRDYFRVQLTTGECLWLFWDVASSGWFLHGVF